MQRSYIVKIHPIKEKAGGYWAEVPALPGCFTQGETLEEVMRMAKEAIELYLESFSDDDEPMPIEHIRSKTFTLPIAVNAPK